jgi:GT2 family glycosyltransferase
MKISIVIVNYNGAAYLENCINSIFQSQFNQDEIEIIIIDNASVDKSIELLESTYNNKITLIKNTENKGFSTANNQGFKLAKGEFVFILNNDTIIKPDTLSQLVIYMEKNPEIGAIQPMLLNADETPQYPGSALGHWKYKSEIPKPVSFLCGAAIFISREFLLELNGFDENFFFYNEDLDLSKRILKKGKPLIYLPTAKVIHLGGQSTKTRAAASLYEGYRGGLYFCYKHYPFLVCLLYRFLFIIMMGILLITKCLNAEYRWVYINMIKNCLTLENIKPKDIKWN